MSTKERAASPFRNARAGTAALVLFVGLAVVGAVGHRVTESSMRAGVADDLRTILAADVEALRFWLESQRNTADLLATEPAVRTDIATLLSVATPANPAVLSNHPAAARLRGRLGPIAVGQGFVGYFVSGNGMTLASSFDPLVGDTTPPAPDITPYVTRVLSGETLVTRPLIIGTAADTVPGVEELNVRAGQPFMFVAAPVRDTAGRPVASLGLGVAPEQEFTRILSVARLGETGETYAIDSAGTFLSRSRFDSVLAAVGRLRDGPASTSVLSISARDPGGDVTRGHEPTGSPRSWPLTRMAAEAIQSNYAPATDDRGIRADVDGYRNYLGIDVVGAWTWFPEYGFGVATEVQAREAFAVLRVVRIVLRTLFGLLVVSAAAVLVIHLLKRRVEIRLRATTVGQYRLEKQIGAGGMGQVFRASHMLLRRPTAVKLLRVDRVSDVAVRRFEREVRHTSKLTHPNTVAVYDYGRTPDGRFYYAMEYLPGITIQDLVHQTGPLPPGRVVHVLRQAAGSLAEAHDAGLIHRDVKPSNIMLCERGGMFDFVKVLDFGLVRDTSGTETLALTNPEFIAGTPLFLSPEAIRDPTNVDGRTDIYALGAVAYFMLAGVPPFEDSSILGVLDRHLREAPAAPSSRRADPINPALESLVLRMLAKDPAARPQTAKAVEAELMRLASVESWTDSAARNWWEQHAQQREETHAWHVDFVQSSETPDSGQRPTLVVDAAWRSDADDDTVDESRS